MPIIHTRIHSKILKFNRRIQKWSFLRAVHFKPALKFLFKTSIGITLETKMTTADRWSIKETTPLIPS